MPKIRPVAASDIEELQRKAKALIGKKKGFPAELAAQILAVKSGRPLRVIVHILEHGSVSTEQLNTEYGYDQPPRAARDVREHGIRLKSSVGSTQAGRRMAIYAFDFDAKVERHKSGRQMFDKATKSMLMEDRDEVACNLCGAVLLASQLQIDHRIPFQISGELRREDWTREWLMLLCASCNRSKSWACEHCPNWAAQDQKQCQSCYWPNNSRYTHTAMVPERRLTLSWVGPDVVDHDDVQDEARRLGLGLPVADDAEQPSR